MQVTAEKNWMERDNYAFIGLVLFAFCFFLIGLLGSNSNGQIVTTQLFFFLATILSMRLVLVNRCKKQLLLLVILLYLIIMIGLFYLLDMFDDAFDSEAYRDFGRLMLAKDNLGKEVVNEAMDFADWGYYYLIGLLYHSFGVFWGEVAMSIIHILSHLISCAFIYNITYDLLGRKAALSVATIWGFNVFTVYCITGGLKEPIFEFVCISASYYMYKLQRRFSIGNLSAFLFFIFLSAFFRAVFPFYFIVVYLAFRFLPKLINNHFGLCVAFGFFFVLLGSSVVTALYPEAMGMIQDKESQFDELGGAYVILNIVNAFISPYPSSGVNESNFNLFIAPFAIIHICFAFFALSGIFFSIKHRLLKLYPFISIYLLNCIMLIFVGFAMNARYHYPVWALYYMMIPIGMKFYNKKYFRFYLVGAFCVTMLYNLR